MTPTVEGPSTRVYHVRFRDGKTVSVRAMTICLPSTSDRFYTLKLEDGTIVAQYEGKDVSGWRMEEVRASVSAPKVVS